MVKSCIKQEVLKGFEVAGVKYWIAGRERLRDLYLVMNCYTFVVINTMWDKKGGKVST